MDYEGQNRSNMGFFFFFSTLTAYMSTIMGTPIPGRGGSLFPTRGCQTQGVARRVYHPPDTPPPRTQQPDLITLGANRLKIFPAKRLRYFPLQADY